MAGIKLSVTDPVIDANPEVREYLERISAHLSQKLDIQTYREHLVVYGTASIEFLHDGSVVTE